MNGSLSEVEATPSLVVDLPVVEQNLRRMAEYGRSHRLGIRPHSKTHKSLRIGQLQMQHGAVGLTAAKVGEAEVMGQVCDDLLIAYPIVDHHRASRAAALAHHKTVRVALDTAAAVDAVATAAREAGSTIGVLVDLDVGPHRTGVQSPAAALQLAQHVANSGGLRLDGIFFYPGHVWQPPDQQGDALASVDALLAETLDLWRRAGLEAKILSGGSTPTAYQSHLVTRATEIRPGTYPYNDMNTVRGGFCGLDDCAARIICTVVSDAVPDKVVIDAGSKTLTSDRNILQPDSGHGHVVEFPEAKIVRLSEEHGEVDVSRCQRRPKVGQRVSVIPNHICPCVNLQDNVWLRLGNGQLQTMRIDARGLLS